MLSPFPYISTSQPHWPQDIQKANISSSWISTILWLARAPRGWPELTSMRNVDISMGSDETLIGSRFSELLGVISGQTKTLESSWWAWLGVTSGVTLRCFEEGTLFDLAASFLVLEGWLLLLAMIESTLFCFCSSNISFLYFCRPMSATSAQNNLTLSSQLCHDVAILLDRSVKL